MTTCTAWAITLLYAIGGVLPLLGIALAGIRIGGPVKAYLARQRHAAELHDLYQKRQESITTEEERDAVEEWMNDELTKKDQSGIAYNHTDSVLFGYSPMAQQASQYREIRRDVIFVGLGVACATVASIWSIWGSTPPA